MNQNAPGTWRVRVDHWLIDTHGIARHLQYVAWEDERIKNDMRISALSAANTFFRRTKSRIFAVDGRDAWMACEVEARASTSVNAYDNRKAPCNPCPSSVQLRVISSFNLSLSWAMVTTGGIRSK